MIKLFNAILVATRNAEELTPGGLSKGSGLKDEVRRKREKDNLLGRGKEVGEVLTKEGFLDLVRRG